MMFAKFVEKKIEALEKYLHQFYSSQSVHQNVLRSVTVPMRNKI